MRLPRKGILIRLCIYVPLILFFGWKAYVRCQAEKAAEQAAAPDRSALEIEGTRRQVTTPDGKTFEYIEISEDQAKKLGFDPGADAKPAEAPAKAPAAEDPKAPAAPPPAAN